MKNTWRVTPLDNPVDSGLLTVRTSISGTKGHLRIGARTTRCLREQKKKETGLRSSTATLGVPQVSPHSLLPDTAEPTSVEDAVNEDQCVPAVPASDCTMLRVQ